MIEINENWKPVDGYTDRYLVSKFGEVYSIRSKQILHPELRRGYPSVQLFDGMQYKHKQIHRLVAIAFIDNPHSYLYINHKDECKTNNNVDNLEWCTASYNVNYGTAIQRAVDKKKIGVNQYLKDGTFVATYDSIMNAERATGVYNPNIVKCCKGERKTAGKYIWKYAN